MFQHCQCRTWPDKGLEAPLARVEECVESSDWPSRSLQFRLAGRDGTCEGLLGLHRADLFKSIDCHACREHSHSGRGERGQTVFIRGENLEWCP